MKIEVQQIAGWDPQPFKIEDPRAEQSSQEIQRGQGSAETQKVKLYRQPAGIPQPIKIEDPREQGSEEIPGTKEVQKHKTNEAEEPDDTSTQRKKRAEIFSSILTNTLKQSYDTS